MFAVAGMLFMRKNPFVAGLGIGLAGCAKVSIGIWGLAMLWAYRREPKKALLLCLGTAHPDGAGVRGLAADRVLPGAAQRRLRLGRLVGQPGLPVPRPVHDRVPRQGRRRDHLLRRAVPDRLDPVPGGAVDGRAGSGQGCRPAAGPADHRPAYGAGAVGRLADHLDVHAVLVRPDRLDAAGRAGGQQAGPDHADAHRAAVAGLRARAGRSTSGPALDFTANRVRDTFSPIVQFAVLLAVVLWWRRPDRPELFPLRAVGGAPPSLTSSRPPGQHGAPVEDQARASRRTRRRSA